jgi:hypothetical protein
VIGSRRSRVIAAAAALALAAGAGTVSVRASRAQLAAIEACGAVARGDHARAVALAEGASRAGETGRTAAECRCRALLALGDDAACGALLAELAADPDWTPASDLLGPAIDARARIEPEPVVLASLALRLPHHGDDAARGRALIAQRHLHLGDAGAALEALGEPPPGAGGEALSVWFDTRMTAHAQRGDGEAARRARDAWLAAGGDRVVVRARYALALSVSGLADPEHDVIHLLERALAETAPGGDPRLREGLAIRLVLTLAAAERHDDALAAYDRLRGELALDGLSRDELVRAARGRRLAGASAAARRGTLRFRAEAPPAGAWLLVSPDAGTPEDAPFERHPLPDSGVVELARSEADLPQRWVLRAAGGVLASGTVTPRAGETLELPIAHRGAALLAPGHVRARRVGDGRRRVALVLLDCGDWHLVGYLRARGELPVLSALLRDGWRAVLDSDPPLTAAALEALVWPGARGGDSLLGLTHQIGVELAGLASVGDNPFGALRFVLPERADLFAAIGAGDRVAANLLLAHGGIRAGRHGEVSGPQGARGRVPIGRAARELDPAERERFPELAAAASPRDRHQIHTLAAELDAAAELARSGAHDLLAVRIEPLDILTHASFAAAAADGQDGGEGLLYAVYRYIDARLAEVDAALDEDDVLVVMSDHGIRTAMEHSRDAIFVAAGAGIPAGRAAGRPALAGVPRALASLLGVATDWPDTGIDLPVAGVAAGRRAAPAPAGPGRR